MRQEICRWALVASVALYAISLILTAFTCNQGAISGFSALTKGWVPAIFGIFVVIGSMLHGDSTISYLGTLSWFANPMMLILWAWLLIKFRAGAIFVALATFCIGSLFWVLNEIPVPDGEGITQVHAGAGCICWMGSMIFGMISAFFLKQAEATSA